MGGKPLTGEPRQAEFIKAGVAIPYAEVDAGHYLIDAFWQAGPDKVGPVGGTIPLGPQDVWYFCLNTGLTWAAWERDAILKMSIAYCVGRSEGKDPFSIAPIDRD